MTAVCAHCQAVLAPDAPEGLCPRCLLGPAVPPEGIDEPTTGHAFTPPTPAELGPFFPQLQILDLLGQGGMGAVYRARQVKLDRVVALKILPPSTSRDAAFAERFTREARALARLAHPNIVAVHDFGDVNGLYYLVMEYVEGVNLRQAMAGGKLAPKQALAVVAELCSALQYAHEAGVVHRDIKPENVLIDRWGKVKVADFGLAKLVGQTQAPARLTGTRQAMGTPHYMAPEQWERPLEVDHRADIYSLGVVFYELLTGELPLGKFAPPSHKAGGDARLDGVVLRAMEKEPEQRYQQMSELKSAVESVALDQPTPSRAGANWPELIVRCFCIALAAGVVRGFYELSSPLEWIPYLGTWAFSLSMVIGGGVGLLAYVLLWAGPNAAVARSNLLPNRMGHPSGGAAELGLSQNEAELWLLLKKAARHHTIAPQLTVIPDHDGETLAAMRKLCAVPPEECVLGILDLQGNNEDAALLFGSRGLCWRNADDSPHAGVGALPYAELAARRLVDHGSEVYLGQNQYICPNEENSGVSASTVTALLCQVRDLMAPRSQSSAPL